MAKRGCFGEGGIMARFCPLVNRRVVYLDCLECENKVCKNKQPKKTGIITQKDNISVEKTSRK